MVFKRKDHRFPIIITKLFFSSFDDSNWPQFNAFLTNSSSMASINNVSNIFIWFRSFLHHLKNWVELITVTATLEYFLVFEKYPVLCAYFKLWDYWRAPLLNTPEVLSTSKSNYLRIFIFLQTKVNFGYQSWIFKVELLQCPI